MTALVETLAGLARPWADFYGDSSLAQSAVAFLHFGGLVTAGGLAFAADRAALRAWRRPDEERRRYLRELAATHRPVLIGLAVVVLSGLAMLLADVEALLPSPVFWMKMGAFALLLLNGLTIRRAERMLSAPAPEPAAGAAGEEPDRDAPPRPQRRADPEAPWRSLRRAALRSAGLWLTVLLLGTLLTSAA
jgi:uncharacterized membrane protein